MSKRPERSTEHAPSETAELYSRRTQRTTKMRSRRAKFTQSDAKRLFKAAVKAGVDVRLEFRPDGTIIATPHKLAEADGADALPSDSPEEIRKLI